jgi:hypothetical protein
LAYHREFDYVAERMCPVKSRAWAQLCHVDLTRFGGQFVVSLSDSLPSSNV